MLPIDAGQSDWDCVLESTPDSDSPAVRMGLRYVLGLVEEQALAIVAARHERPFSDVADLAHRAKLTKRSLDLLAKADGLRSIVGHRRNAAWSARGTDRLPGMLEGAGAKESAIVLTAPTEGQDIVADYRATGTSLRRHPLALLRPKLRRLKVRTAAELISTANGATVRVAGIVTHRQRPETASGVMFVSLEDETGISNLVVWKTVQAEQRQPLLAATLMIVEGECQNEQGVIHVVAHQIRDYTGWLGALSIGSRDFH